MVLSVAFFGAARAQMFYVYDGPGSQAVAGTAARQRPIHANQLMVAQEPAAIRPDFSPPTSDAG